MTLVDTTLDQDVIDELTPPCVMRDARGVLCAQPAKWVAMLRCARPLLVCDDHVGFVRIPNLPVVCDHGRCAVISVEKL